jgi:hypothetical protein
MINVDPGGAGVEYEREKYFGRVLGYAINDHGEDRLGRTRKNVEVPDDLRGDSPSAPPVPAR